MVRLGWAYASVVLLPQMCCHDTTRCHTTICLTSHNISGWLLIKIFELKNREASLSFMGLMPQEEKKVNHYLLYDNMASLFFSSLAPDQTKQSLVYALDLRVEVQYV